jgi:hypothetical protein
MSNKLGSFDILEEDDGWKLLEERSINDRTLVCWYNPNNQIISVALFHLTDNIRNISVKNDFWGFPTYYVTRMHTPTEAANIVSLYLKDMEDGNFWWEKV